VTRSCFLTRDLASPSGPFVRSPPTRLAAGTRAVGRSPQSDQSLSNPASKTSLLGVAAMRLISHSIAA
jgi:hypothetical protein